MVFRASERDAGLLVRAEVLSAVSPVFRAFLALGHEPLPRVITTHCPRESNAAFLELVSTLAFETRPSDQPPTPARLTLRLLQLGADAMPLLFKYDVRGVVKTLKTVMADELVCNFTHWVATQVRRAASNANLPPARRPAAPCHPRGPISRRALRRRADQVPARRRAPRAVEGGRAAAVLHRLGW